MELLWDSDVGMIMNQVGYEGPDTQLVFVFDLMNCVSKGLADFVPF